MSTKRTLQLEHSEIELIENALQIVYDLKLKLLRENVSLLNKDEYGLIVKTANKFDDLRISIADGEKDV